MKNKNKNPWAHNTPENSKKFKLPKKFWQKGKSKFVAIRLHDEGAASVNQL